YNHSLGAAIAIIMALAQLVVVVAVLGLRSLFYRGAASGTKG
ncbi:MAG: ABC transporter permease, partial [Rhizobiaceae bacterium]